jgi:hypothetical protein
MARLHASISSSARRIPKGAARIVVATAAIAVLAGVAFRSRSVLPEFERLQRPDARWLVLAILARSAP